MNEDTTPKKDFPEIIPVIAIRDVVMFPHMPLPLSVDRKRSVAAIESALQEKKYILAVAQKNGKVEEPRAADLYSFGVLCVITQSLKMPNGTMRVFIEGRRRARIKNLGLTQKNEHFIAEVEYLDDIVEEGPKLTALLRRAVEIFEEYVKLSAHITLDARAFIAEEQKDPSKLADTIAANTTLNLPDKQDVLETTDVCLRFEKIINLLSNETEILNLEQKIQNRIKGQMNKAQKEHYLNEQMKAIQQELHQKDDYSQEIDNLKKKVKDANMPKEANAAAEKELERLSHMSPYSPETSVSRTYLDWLLALPWNTETKDSIDIKKAKEILDEDHFGLKKPKDRVLEYLAVCKLTNQLQGPVLCFVGPPGVGKTSIAKSIARSMGRKFVRMSLGGVRDEAEIRGHRRTYVASMPGRIIQGIKKAGSRNPVFLMDEIDKLANDTHGDPASALLEVMDTQQNSEFADHYLDVPFDISKVMFITTANTLWGIPAPLRDRMEIIEFSGYTHNEKISIARKYILPRRLKEHGLKEDSIIITDKGLDSVIRCYTSEAGVRTLDREIASLCRRVARKVVEDGISSVEINEKNLPDFLGIPKYIAEKPSLNSVGLCTGLAWTEHGGELLTVESLAVPGKGALILTGKLGDVMKESAQTAFSFIKSKEYVPAKYIDTHNFHIHVPEGAIPKDGPSAGITMATVLASLLTGRAVKPGISMTGEITLTGRVLAIGGLKEKTIASFREGIKTVLFPEANKKDLEDIPEEIRKEMKLIPVSSMDEVLDLVLEKSKNKTEGTDVPVRKNEKKNTKKKTKVKQTERA
ncbi:MAG: endopeptidase La [Elusimicrobiales bacterium]|nr:endopeptidase La [Elusimicrobiales bacterium]